MLERLRDFRSQWVAVSIPFILPQICTFTTLSHYLLLFHSFTTIHSLALYSHKLPCIPISPLSTYHSRSRRKMCHNKKVLWLCGCHKETTLVVCNEGRTLRSRKAWRASACPQEDWSGQALEVDNWSEGKKCPACIGRERNQGGLNHMFNWNAYYFER